jgi:DNA-binding MarR family transcriptional regulator
MKETNSGHERMGAPLEQDVADIGISMWERERPDIDCSGKAVTGRILRLADVFMSAMNQNMSRFGVRYSQYAIVGTLRASGKPYRMSPSELQGRLMITSGGLSNLLKKVEAQGYIRRLDDPVDGRGVIVELTSEGFELSNGAMTTQAETERALVAALPDDDQRVLANLLRRLVLAHQ